MTKSVHVFSYNRFRWKEAQTIYTIYIDRLFFLTFYMNLLLLLSVDCILGGTATRRRILLSALVGTIGYCVLFFFPIRKYLWLVRSFGGLGIAASMVRICFGRNRQLFGRGVYLLLVCTLTTGGLLVWLQRALPVFFRKYSVLVILSGASILYFAVRSFTLRYRRNSKRIVSVRLVMQGRVYEAKGLFDTGNSLREPISGKPVCVLDRQLAQKIEETIPIQKIVMIPFHTVGKDEGVLYGARFDSLQVEDGRCTAIPDAIVAFSHRNFAESEKFQILLHPELKTERK